MFGLDWPKLLGTFAIIFFIAIAAWDYSSTKSELSNKKAEIMILNDKMELQNSKIQELKLDVEKYKNLKPKVVEKIVKKYEQVQVKDETCEAKLDAIIEAQQMFFEAIHNKGSKTK